MHTHTADTNLAITVPADVLALGHQQAVLTDYQISDVFFLKIAMKPVDQLAHVIQNGGPELHILRFVQLQLLTFWIV